MEFDTCVMCDELGAEWAGRDSVLPRIFRDDETVFGVARCVGEQVEEVVPSSGLSREAE